MEKEEYEEIHNKIFDKYTEADYIQRRRWHNHMIKRYKYVIIAALSFHEPVCMVQNVYIWTDKENIGNAKKEVIMKIQKAKEEAGGAHPEKVDILTVNVLKNTWENVRFMIQYPR